MSSGREEATMTSLAHATVPVRENVRLARDTTAPSRLPRAGLGYRRTVPHAPPAGSTAPLLDRPFALYDTVLDAPDNRRCRRRLSRRRQTDGIAEGCWRAGESVTIWGPLGNGFPDLPP